MRYRGNVGVISQLPPPVHGSTLMTKILLEVLADLGQTTRLVERNFSTTASEVGNYSARKILQIPSLVFRTISLAWAFRSGRGPIIFFVTNRPGSFLIDYVLGEILRMFHVVRVDYVHTVGFRALAGKGPIWSVLVRRFLGGAKITVCLSQHLTKDVLKTGGRSPRVIPNSVQPPRSFQARTPKKHNLLFMSNLLPHKGVDTFLRIAESIGAAFPDFHFRIAGGTSDPVLLQQFEAAVTQNTMSSRIRTLGHVSGKTKWAELATASLLVFPSDYPYEAFPLTIVEAMSVGTPVVSFAIGGIPDILEGELAGLCVPRGDEQKMQQIIEHLLSCPRELSHLSRLSKELFEKKYTRSVYSNLWDEVLSEAME